MDTKNYGLNRKAAGQVTPIHLITSATLASWVDNAAPRVARWVSESGFTGRPGSLCRIPGDEGQIAMVLAGYAEQNGPFAFSHLPSALVTGQFELAGRTSRKLAENVTLGWALGTYVFDRYKESKTRFADLVVPDGVDIAASQRAATGTFLVRDLINTPAEDLGPAELADTAIEIGKRHGAKVRIIVGDDLLKKNYPTIHIVGRASVSPPRLIDLRWEGPRSKTAPLITLVGKGVIFDSGGLQIKPGAGMKFMKKDMGGSAHVLALAEMILSAKLHIRLRVLVPAVENAISDNAFRPLDIVRTRKGLTVEVGHTDAEGRLVLCDALAEADSDEPDLLIDFATLTGAARVALGNELPAVFCNNEKVAKQLLSAADKTEDPLWRMPLHQPYRHVIDSSIADLSSTGSVPLGGSIAAALFLREFVSPETPWVHIDLSAWNTSGRPGQPAGGEAMGLRAVYRLVEELAATRKSPRAAKSAPASTSGSAKKAPKKSKKPRK